MKVGALYILVFFAIVVTSREAKRFLATRMERGAALTDTIPALPVLEVGFVSPYGEEFDNELRRMAYELGLEMSWVKAVVAAESGWNYRAVNPTSGAAGLIQFMPGTLDGMGTTRDELFAAPPAAQIALMKRFWQGAKGRVFSSTDLRLYTFYPAALDRDDSWVMGGREVAKSNPTFDTDGDGVITVGEYRRKVEGGAR
jgi:hypothetical protein